jgi:hypothetical protein
VTLELGQRGSVVPIHHLVNRRHACIAAIAALVLGCSNREGEEATLAKGSSVEPVVNADAPPSPEPEPTASAEPVVIPPPDAPVVDLAGVTNLSGPIAEGRNRIGAVRWLVKVYERPSDQSKLLGYLRAGTVVEALGGTAPATKGCKNGWQEIAPVGWACTDRMSTDLDHEVLRAARGPDFGHRLPYMYGVVTRGGPVYARIPTKEQLAEHEPSLSTHLAKWKNDDESGATYGLDVWLRHSQAPNVPTALEALDQRYTSPDMPWFLAGGRVAPNVSGLIKSDEAVKIDQVNRRQGRSFTHSFVHEGRRYNVTPDLVVVPADRFRPIRGSDFHGWQVDRELKFPFALIRRDGAKKWLWKSDKKRMVDGGSLKWRSAVLLTGKQQIYKNVLHYETTEGFYVDDRHASRVDPAKKWPKWAQNGEKWIDINLTKQVLVAYEGTKMVYATLVSTGEAGLADPTESTATIRGIYRIDRKFVTATMSSDEVGEEFELRDVPYVQYFHEGYALHGAYWHDRFGQPKSHGCINLAPEDARRLFFWTDPQVPARWHGSRDPLKGTVVFVHP